MEKNLNILDVSKIILEDHKTGGKCYNCYVTIEQYENMIKDSFDRTNEFQRKVISIKRSTIYQKLVRDLLRGVVIPTISLYFNTKDEIKKSLTIDDERIQILDGLQRTNCILYALELLRKETPDEMKLINGDSLSLEEFMNKIIRLEVWIDLTVNGILYKMVSLNAGQTPMDIKHQFEIIELPLREQLEQKYGINVYRKSEAKQRNSMKEFYLADIVEGIFAYNTENFSPKKQENAIDILDRLETYKNERKSVIAKNDYLMEDLVWVIRDLHEKQKLTYDSNGLEGFASIMSSTSTFFIPFMAALGKARKDLEEQKFLQRKDKLIELLDDDSNDPWNLQVYEIINNEFRSDIGNKRRKLVYATFMLFFQGIQDKLDWTAARNFI